MISRLRWELKNLRWLYVLPVAMAWVLLPLLNHMTYRDFGSDEVAFTAIGQAAQRYLPFLASWWPMLILKEYLHSSGKELLAVYRSGWDSLWLRMLALWALFWLHAAPLLVSYQARFGNIFLLTALLLAQSLFVIALGYAVAMLSRNAFLPLLLNFLYCALFNTVLPKADCSIFLYETPLIHGFYWQHVLGVTLAAAALLAVGILREARLGKA